MKFREQGKGADLAFSSKVVKSCWQRFCPRSNFRQALLSFFQLALTFGLPCSSPHFPISASILLSQFGWHPPSSASARPGYLPWSSSSTSPRVIARHPGLLAARILLGQLGQKHSQPPTAPFGDFLSSDPHHTPWL